jgi:aspartate kinase
MMPAGLPVDIPAPRPAPRPARRTAPGGRAATEIVVQKFGGSSLATAAKLRVAADLIARTHRAGLATVVVVSARGDTTDDLLRLAGGAHGGVRSARTAREIDQLLATGESASAALLAMSVDRLGVPAISLTCRQAGILATGRHGFGVITAIETGRLMELLDAGYVVVVAGFQGIDADGDVITLGRGGSDTTAVALAATLNADRCEIYTDVDGVFSADPRIVPAARSLPRVDAGLMAEMAFAGARVLHSRAVELAAMRGVDLQVRRIPVGGSGTAIITGGTDVMLESAGAVVAITHDLDVARVLVHAVGGRRDPTAEILSVLARHSVPVDLVARSGPNEDEFRMGFTVRRSDLADVRLALSEAALGLGGGLRVDEDVAKVSLIGMGLLNRPEYAARMITAVAAAGIAISWLSTSQLRTSVIVPLARAIHVVELLHDTFALDRDGLECAT